VTVLLIVRIVVLANAGIALGKGSGAGSGRRSRRFIGPTRLHVNPDKPGVVDDRVQH
jgi:hypothetical protein